MGFKKLFYILKNKEDASPILGSFTYSDVGLLSIFEDELSKLDNYTFIGYTYPDKNIPEFETGTRGVK